MKKDEELKSPPVRYSTEQDGYSMIATNVPLFQAINELPITLDSVRLDEGGSIEETLRRNKAKYHQSCRLMFNNTKLERAKKRASTEESTTDERVCKMRRASHEIGRSECFLCEKEAPPSALRQAMTMQLNARLNECARTLNDGRLLAKLSAGDAVAQELKYHPSCLTALYNRVRASNLAAEKQQTSEEKDAYPLAFSELVTYITETKASSKGPAVFRLAEMTSLYKQRA